MALAMALAMAMVMANKKKGIKMKENKARDAWDRAWSLHMDEFSNKFSNDLIDMEERGSWLCKNWFNAGYTACEDDMREEMDENILTWKPDLLKRDIALEFLKSRGVYPRRESRYAFTRNDGYREVAVCELYAGVVLDIVVALQDEIEELKNHWMFDEDYSDLYTHFGSCFYCGQLTGLNKKNLLCEKHDFHGLFRKYRKRIKYLENKLSTTCTELTDEK